MIFNNNNIGAAMQTAIIDEAFLEAEASKYLTRKERKQKKRAKGTGFRQPAIPSLCRVSPKTNAQRKVVDAFNSDKNIIMHGCAGTGKTFLAVWLSMNSILEGDAPKPIVILRSVVPTRDIGFLPGSVKDKAAAYEAPYQGIVSEICDKPYEWLKTNGYIQFDTTSFLRGLTFRDNIIIVDECQNLSDHEIHTVMTRVGEGCRVIFCGDFTQKDYTREGSGMNNLLTVAAQMKSFEVVKFNKEDVVRSGFVKEYILTRTDLEERGLIA
jgi:phosphate starvation-inducible protein PhoH and related proteins